MNKIAEHEDKRMMDLQLQGEVMACPYEDVQVMWSILDKSNQRMCNVSSWNFQGGKQKERWMSLWLYNNKIKNLCLFFIVVSLSLSLAYLVSYESGWLPYVWCFFYLDQDDNQGLIPRGRRAKEEWILKKYMVRWSRRRYDEFPL